MHVNLTEAFTGFLSPKLCWDSISRGSRGSPAITLFIWGRLGISLFSMRQSGDHFISHILHCYTALIEQQNQNHCGKDHENLI